MGELKKLFGMLNSDFCRYEQNGKYFSILNNELKLNNAEEILSIVKNKPKEKEQLLVACFKDDPTKILYYGENAQSMKKTIDELKLPKSWPTNLGEKVFCLFRDEFDKLKNEDYVGSILLEQDVVKGKERQFELILKKLIRVYSGGKIDSEFYKNLKNNTHDTNCTFSGLTIN